MTVDDIKFIPDTMIYRKITLQNLNKVSEKENNKIISNIKIFFVNNIDTHHVIIFFPIYYWE